jgi:hypothetical protein
MEESLLSGEDAIEDDDEYEDESGEARGVRFN